MGRRHLIELTNKLYRLTLLFPKKEPLRYKIRKTAIDILSDVVKWECLNSPNPGKYVNDFELKRKEIIFSMENNLEVINNYFEIAKWQNWINYFDILEIQEEYDKIKFNLFEEIKKIELNNLTIKPAIFFNNRNSSIETESIKAEENLFNNSSKDFESRRDKILKILKKVERIQVGEINKLFPDVSKRTIRRDFQKMLNQGIIQRIGEKNNTFYILKNS